VVVAEHRPLIDKRAWPHLRGTPFTPDDVYSKIQYDIAEEAGWFYRMWVDNEGSFQSTEAAIVSAVQRTIRSLKRDWIRELERLAPQGDMEVESSTHTLDTSPERWAEAYGARQEILDAIQNAGLTSGQACLVRAQLDDLGREEVDQLLARELGRDDPANMSKTELERFHTYQRKIRERAYGKIRYYIERKRREQ
jgi:hypothetical protein